MELAKSLPSIFKLAKTIHDITKQVKANKNQCQRLNERIQSVVAVLESGVGNDSDTKAMERALKSLDETLKESAAFVKEFTDSSVFARFLNNSDHQQKFETLSAQLSHNATDLNLALNITLIFDHHQDVADRQADLAEILCKIDEIAFEMTKQHQELLNQNKDMQNEFKRRFDSFKFCLQQDVLKAQNPVEAKKIEEESKLFLHIPGHDLVREERIGQGGFADVYKGTWRSQHHRVAIKTIRITDLQDNVKQNFLDEIATMYKIRYDYVLDIFGACIEPNYHALVVEYMSLGSLFDVLKKKEHIRSWEDRWPIALQMTKGVNYLHTISILHRDIKSLNFLMDKAIDGYIVKISDFGLAKIRQETSRQTTKRAEQVSVTGSLLWTAPELLKLGKPSKASDIYSLGVVFWELATGCEPYEGISEAIISRSVKDGERLEMPDDVPTTFASIISNAWCQEPNKRPTAEALIQEIKTASLVTAERSVTPMSSLTTAQPNDSSSIRLANHPIKPPATSLADVSSKVVSELNTYRNPKLEVFIAQFRPCSTVHLNKQNLTDPDMEIVVQQAIVNKQCGNLSLQHNKITSKGALILAKALYGNITLYELWLYDNDVSDIGVQHLAGALWANKTLKKLGLTRNNITDVGVPHLVEMIKRNNTLTMLGLAMNTIGDEGVQMLANALAHQNTSLEVLALDRNELISDSSINSLVTMIRHNRSIKELWVNDCNLSDIGKKELREMIASKKDFKLMTEHKDSS